MPQLSEKTKEESIPSKSKEDSFMTILIIPDEVKATKITLQQQRHFIGRNHFKTTC